MLYRNMKRIFILIITLVAFTLCQAQNVDLSLKLEKGKVYKQVIRSKINTVQRIDIQIVKGVELEDIMTTTGIMNFFVKDINETGYLMAVTFDSLDISIQMPQTFQGYSSGAMNPNDPFAPILEAMKQITFEIVMSKKGKVIEIRNLEVVWNAVVDQSKGLSETQREQFKTYLMQVYGDDAMKDNIEMVTAIFPDKPVNKGDKWTVDTDLDPTLFLGTNVSTNYHLTDLTPDYALIIGTADFKTDDKDLSGEYADEMAVTRESEIKVDKNTGWIIEAKINQEIKGNINVEDTPKMSDGMKMLTIVTTEMVVKDK